MIERLELRQMLAADTSQVQPNGSYISGHVFTITEPASLSGVINIPASATTYSLNFNANVQNPTFGEFPANTHETASLVVLKSNAGTTTSQTFGATISADKRTLSFPGQIVVPAGFTHTTFRAQRSGNPPQSIAVDDAFIDTFVNRIPSAPSPAFDTPEDARFNGQISATDADGNALTFSIVTAPTRGTIASGIDSNGNFTYQPNLDENGADFFDYEVRDVHGATARGRVTINIQPVQDGPKFTRDPLVVTVPQRGSVTIDPTEDAYDPEGDLIDPNSTEIADAPAHGRAEYNATQQKIVYTPDGTSTGEDSFTYTIADEGNHRSGKRTVKITLVAEPVITGLIDNVDPFNQPTTGVTISLPAFTNDTTPELTGTADKNATVVIVGSGINAAPTQANDQGKWTIPLGSLAPGQTYTVHAEATVNGKTASGPSVQFTIDTAFPRLAATNAPALPQQTISDIRFEFRDSNGLADPVTGLDLSDFTLFKSGSTQNLLAGAANVSLIPTSPVGGFADTYTLQNLKSVIKDAGSYELAVSDVAPAITDLASNPVSNAFAMQFAVDTQAPEVKQFKLKTSKLNSQLPIAVVDAGGADSATVKYSAELIDQQFKAMENHLTVSLLEVVSGNEQPIPGVVPTTVTIPQGAADDLEFALPALTLSANLPLGLHTLRLRVTDDAMHSVIQDVKIFISSVGAATPEAPNTPSLTEKWFLGAHVKSVNGNQITVDQPIPKDTVVSIPARDNMTGVTSLQTYSVTESMAAGPGLTTLTLALTPPDPADDSTIEVDAKVTWLRPWTTTFDKATQTTWLTMEDGVRVAQFDPATGAVKLFDVSLPTAPLGPAIYGDPHGVSFDFNGHLTPRVWFVYRNSNLDRDKPSFPADYPSTIGYVDVADNTLHTVFLKDLLLTNTASGSHTADLAGTHAVFTDTRGHVWITAEDANPPAILEIDLSRTPSGSPLPLNSSSGTIIVHNIPAALGKGVFAPHGLTVEVDEVTGTPYVFLSDGPDGQQPTKSTGRLVLLRPGSDAADDTWIEWNIDEAIQAENRESASALFLTIDNNETPGDLRDDRLIASDPGALQNKPGGIIRVFDLASVVGPMVEQDRLRFAGKPFSAPELPEKARVTGYKLPLVPGVNATLPSPQVPFVDRGGEIFYADATAGFGRFSIDGFNSAFREDSIMAPLTTYASYHDIGGIAFSDGVQVPILKFNAQAVQTLVSPADRSTVPGVDVYEVAQPATAAYGGAGQRGLFRGALNAENTFYGSMASSDHVGTSMVAESNRRQMAVVLSTSTPPAGSSIYGRAAFQVLRDGSVVLTGHGDGELLDQQVNLTKGLFKAGRLATFDDAAVMGDVAAIDRPGGGIELLGRRTSGQLLRYRFQPPQTAWKTSDLVNVQNWTVTPVDMPNSQIAAEDPAPVRGLGFTVTSAAGHLIVVRADGTAVDLYDLAIHKEPVYAGVGGIILGDDKVKFYGGNQTGQVVEYSATLGPNATFTNVTSKVLVVPNTPAVRPGGDEDRDIRLLRNIRPLVDGSTIHLFGGDGVSRLVHYELDLNGNVKLAENVTRAIPSSNAFGYFSFEQPYAGRVYTYLSVFKDTDGSLRVYGTNGGELIEFTRNPAGQWRVGNLTNDIRSTNPITAATPGTRIPANAVFGAPAAYLTPAGDRHILQINANGEVVEYYTMAGEPGGRIHTQNVNLRIGSASQIVNLRFRAAAPAATNTLGLPLSPPLVGSPEGAPAITSGAAARFDINGDGRITPLDALLVINELNRTKGQASAPAVLGDTDGNGLLTALDALLVINYLNQQPAGEGEGEGASPVIEQLSTDLSDVSRVKKQVTDGIFETWE